MDNTREIVLEKEADSPIPGLLISETPRLYIDCKGASVQVGVTMELLSYLGVTRIKLDNGMPEKQEKWREPYPGQGYFVAPNSVQLARRMGQSHILLLELRGNSRPPETAEFGLDGLDKYFDASVGSCR